MRSPAAQHDHLNHLPRNQAERLGADGDLVQESIGLKDLQEAEEPRQQKQPEEQAG